MITPELRSSILTRPMLALREDEHLSGVLTQLAANEAHLKKADLAFPYWRLYLSKKGFHATLKKLQRMKPQLSAAEYCDLYSQTLAICGREEQELRFLKERCAAFPWYFNRLMRNHLRNADFEAFYQAVEQAAASRADRLRPLVADFLWALGDAETYRRHRDGFFRGFQRTGFFDAVFASFAGRPDNESLFHLIHIPAEARRLALTVKPLARCGIRWQEVEGLDGSRIPQALLPSLGTQRGIFGTGCSHLRIWEDLVQSDRKGALVIECDAALAVNDGALSSKVYDFDFVFLNDRAFDGKIFELSCDSIAVERYLPRPRTIGADAYYISRPLAEALLERFSRDGLTTHVDIQAFGYLRSEAVNTRFAIGRASFPIFRHYPIGLGRRRAMELNY